MSRSDDQELIQSLYIALQAISSCHGECKCCTKHKEKMREALAKFLNRWRDLPTEPEPRCEGCDE